MKTKSPFSKTRMQKAEESLRAKYPENSEIIIKEAEKVLIRELKTANNRGSKVVGMHLRQNILPGYAIYYALQKEGIEKEKAISFVKEEMCGSVAKMSALCHRMSKRKYT